MTPDSATTVRNSPVAPPAGSDVAAIAGGVGGALCLLLTIGVAVAVWRSRKSTRSAADQKLHQQSNYGIVPGPGKALYDVGDVSMGEHYEELRLGPSPGIQVRSTGVGTQYGAL